MNKTKAVEVRTHAVSAPLRPSLAQLNVGIKLKNANNDMNRVFEDNFFIIIFSFGILIDEYDARLFIKADWLITLSTLK